MPSLTLTALPPPRSENALRCTSNLGLLTLTTKSRGRVPIKPLSRMFIEEMFPIPHGANDLPVRVSYYAARRSTSSR
jgi:hypothetical protein